MSKSKYTEEQKLTVFAKLQTGLDARAIADETELPYPIILKWRKEYREAEEAGTIHKLLDADALLLHRVAEEVQHDLEEVAPKEGELIASDVESAVAKIDTYNILNEQCQATAIKLVSKISNMTDTQLGPLELNSLVESLAKIQMAFFNKNTVQMNVLNQTNINEDGVSTFSDFKSKA